MELPFHPLRDRATDNLPTLCPGARFFLQPVPQVRGQLKHSGLNPGMEVPASPVGYLGSD